MNWSYSVTRTSTVEAQRFLDLVTNHLLLELDAKSSTSGTHLVLPTCGKRLNKPPGRASVPPNLDADGWGNEPANFSHLGCWHWRGLLPFRGHDFWHPFGHGTVQLYYYHNRGIQPNHLEFQNVDWKVSPLWWLSPLHWEGVRNWFPSQKRLPSIMRTAMTVKERVLIPGLNLKSTMPGESDLEFRCIRQSKESICSTWLECFVITVWSKIGYMRPPWRRLSLDPRPLCKQKPRASYGAKGSLHVNKETRLPPGR